MAVDSIIFDMDGTIWDTTKQVVECWDYAAKINHVDLRFTSEEIQSCMGLAMEDFAKKLLPSIQDADLRRKMLYDCIGKENQYVEETATEAETLYPKVLPVLKALSEKYPIYIVSNCQNGYIEAFLNAFNFSEYISDYENPVRTGLDKGGNISLICERHQLRHPVYVGDTQGDMLACKKAGVRFIFAAYGFGTVDAADYDACLEQFEDLPELLEQLSAGCPPPSSAQSAKRG